MSFTAYITEFNLEKPSSLFSIFWNNPMVCVLSGKGWNKNTSRHGNALCINGPLWEESIGHRWIPVTNVQWCGALWVSLLQHKTVLICNPLIHTLSALASDYSSMCVHSISHQICTRSVLCFVLFTSSTPVDSSDWLTHYMQGYLIEIGDILWLHWCRWSNAEGCWQNWSVWLISP